MNNDKSSVKFILKKRKKVKYILHRMLVEGSGIGIWLKIWKDPKEKIPQAVGVKKGDIISLPLPQWSLTEYQT